VNEEERRGLVGQRGNGTHFKEHGFGMKENEFTGRVTDCDE
jgi:hypothetical protein